MVQFQSTKLRLSAGVTKLLFIEPIIGLHEPTPLLVMTDGPPAFGDDCLSNYIYASAIKPSPVKL